MMTTLLWAKPIFAVKVNFTYKKDSLRSRRLEVAGERENGRARGGRLEVAGERENGRARGTRKG